MVSYPRCCTGTLPATSLCEHRLKRDKRRQGLHFSNLTAGKKYFSTVLMGSTDFEATLRTTTPREKTTATQKSRGS